MGQLTSTNAFIGDFAGSDGSAYVAGWSDNPTGGISRSTWVNHGGMRVGNAGLGELLIDEAGQVTNDGDSIIGNLPGGNGHVFVELAGRWTNAADLYVGRQGIGELQVTAGGHVTSARGLIGDFSGSNGTAVIRGFASPHLSSWVLSGDLFVGNQGTGTLRIEDRGVVTSGATYIGRLSGSNGNAVVTGSGTQWNTGTLSVGEQGHGELLVSDSGHLTSSTGSYIGKDAGSLGYVVVTGNNSDWSSTTPLFVGYSGSDGRLTVVNGGYVESDGGTIGLFPGSVGTVAVSHDAHWDSSPVLATQPLIVGQLGTAELRVTSRGVVDSTDCVICWFAGSIGTATVDGASSEWNNSSNLYVGNQGTGTLNVSNGGKVVSGGDLYVGSQSTSGNRLEIKSGGKVESGRGFIGDFATGSGTAVIDGIGSSWNSGSELRVGNLGTGRLEIKNGGIVSSTQGTLGYVGFAAGSAGEVHVDGGGSRWDSAELRVGNFGAGLITVLNGGVVSSFFARIGYQNGSNGSVYVAGTGSSFSSGEIHVGGAGTGTLTVHNNGAVTASVGLYTGTTGTLAGEGVVNGNVTNLGGVAPSSGIGELGTLYINGNFSFENSGKLFIDLAATTYHDKVVTSGHVGLGGTLYVTAINGFVPQAGQSFDILDWGTIGGSFADINLQPLSSPLIWKLDQLYSNGVIRVVDSSAVLPGDFNNDGRVDGGDYVVWRKTDGSQAGYNTWRAHFGESAGGGAGAAEGPPHAAVPEPRAILLMFLSVAGLLSIRRASSSWNGKEGKN